MAPARTSVAFWGSGAPPLAAARDERTADHSLRMAPMRSAASRSFATSAQQSGTTICSTWRASRGSAAAESPPGPVATAFRYWSTAWHTQDGGRVTSRARSAQQGRAPPPPPPRHHGPGCPAPVDQHPLPLRRTPKRGRGAPERALEQTRTSADWRPLPAAGRAPADPAQSGCPGPNTHHGGAGHRSAPGWCVGALDFGRNCVEGLGRRGLVHECACPGPATVNMDAGQGGGRGSPNGRIWRPCWGWLRSAPATAAMRRTAGPPTAASHTVKGSGVCSAATGRWKRRCPEGASCAISTNFRRHSAWTWS